MRTQGGGAFVNISAFTAAEPDAPLSRFVRACGGASHSARCTGSGGEARHPENTCCPASSHAPVNEAIRATIPLRVTGAPHDDAKNGSISAVAGSAYITDRASRGRWPHIDAMTKPESRARRGRSFRPTRRTAMVALVGNLLAGSPPAALASRWPSCAVSGVTELRFEPGSRHQPSRGAHRILGKCRRRAEKARPRDRRRNPARRSSPSATAISTRRSRRRSWLRRRRSSSSSDHRRNVIDVRSASRPGLPRLRVNRKRIETLRAALA